MPQAEFPQAELLGMVTVGIAEVRAKPNSDSTIVAKIYEMPLCSGSGRRSAESMAIFF